jgi:hypothetical protein
MTLDTSPASGKIRITWRQRNNRVQMIREYDNRINNKWAFSASRAQRVA